MAKKVTLQGHVEQSDLGIISEKFETGGRGPETVSSGKMGHGKLDPGGPSYGTYQLTSQDSYRDKHTHQLHIVHNGGNVARFLGSEQGRPWAHEFHGLRPGTEEFSARWKEVAARDPQAFGAAEQAYIGDTHFRPQMEKVQRETGLDLSGRSVTIQNVAWSTSVHHGPNTDIISEALREKAGQLNKPVSQLTDHQCIDAIYDKRTERSPDLKDRFDRERGFAHHMLDREGQHPQASLRSLVDDRQPGGGAERGVASVPREVGEGLAERGVAGAATAAAAVTPAVAEVPQKVAEALTGQAVERDPSDKGGSKGVEGKTAKDQDPDLNPLTGRKGVG
jgi:hypothetical protein